MNNLHRGLAPISDAAWAQIEEEASRTLKRHLAARRVVDVDGPKGTDFSAVGTGHLKKIATPGDGVEATQREVRALVELRVPFELSRQAIDDVERGANDPMGELVAVRVRHAALCMMHVMKLGYRGVAGLEHLDVELQRDRLHRFRRHRPGHRRSRRLQGPRCRRRIQLRPQVRSLHRGLRRDAQEAGAVWRLACDSRHV